MITQVDICSNLCLKYNNTPLANIHLCMNKASNTYNMVGTMNGKTQQAESSLYNFLIYEQAKNLGSVYL